MKTCPWGFSDVLISKIAGTTTSLQRFWLKNAKFKMAAKNIVFAHSSVISNSFTMILGSAPMFSGSRIPLEHIKHVLGCRVIVKMLELLAILKFATYFARP